MTVAEPRRVLLVDDEPSVLAVLCATIEAMGHQPFGVGDGQEALRRLADESFDLVVTDIMMPGLNGQDLLEVVRRQWPEMPVIMITGYKTEQSVLDAFRQGVVSYLTKPFRPSELERMVRTALQLDGSVGRAAFELDVPKKGWVELTAPSHQEFVRRFHTFCDLLYETELDAQTKNDIKLAVEELGSNAVEWGNAGDSERRIRITFCIFEDAVSLKIEDEGEGFEAPDAVGVGSAEDAFLGILDRMGSSRRIGGLGLRFVREVMDDVLHSERGNAVLLTKRLR